MTDLRRAGTLAISLALVYGCSSDDSHSSSPANSNDSKPEAGVAGTTSTAGSGNEPAAGAPLLPPAPSNAGELTALNPPCNGHADYCAKPFSEWCQAATHDSAANSPDYWKFCSQDRSVRNQLDNGIRALMLNLQLSSNVVSVCRGSCTDGSTPFGVVLTHVKAFLEANPREVVTLLIESQLSSSQIEADFVVRGLDSLAHTQPLDAPWPTLAAMIEAKRRLVVFANTVDTGAEWMLPRRSFIWETGADFTSLVNMNCNPAVGNATHPLYLVHHNLVEAPASSVANLGLAGAPGTASDGTAGAAGGTGAGVPGQPSVALATQANGFATVTTRLRACADQYGKKPNFVAVDYFNVGDPIGATQVMNGVRRAP